MSHWLRGTLILGRGVRLNLSYQSSSAVQPNRPLSGFGEEFAYWKAGRPSCLLRIQEGEGLALTKKAQKYEMTKPTCNIAKRLCVVLWGFLQ